ncbi:MAG TPA: CoA-binding protein [Rhodospirillaceae bacterium]|nr:CoA-binding protein [Alphaproteobacteria bacterium]MAS46189.1 CoA-binding protein [Alphaproteobacteria bacterium]MBN54236.1 CoA-binding protein [Alphaproteobacteria bacterium]OUT42192.1 MAG: CoA-binding protein [Micavibrio sp. TMED2]HCI45694.1 CoA-binding protein [Rhodospirillaceae bacterium]|tara:strand:+ start:4733 stop:5278 length:546 start_codon:yes stop_codon:yes gene_type:complete
MTTTTEADLPKGHESYTDQHLLDILRSVKTIAMVGASANWNRPSYFVMKYLQQKQYRVIPINPGQAGNEILGEPCYASLAEAAEALGPGVIDMVEVFRHPREAPELARQAVAIGAKVFWMQITVISEEARQIAEDAGLAVIMNRCPKIEYQRLFGEIGRTGVNSRVISSKRQKIKPFKKLM